MVNKCLRCHRPLLDPESQARGYGPLCWQKVQAGETNMRFRKPKVTVTDPSKSCESRFKLLDRIIDLKEPYDKCHCGVRFQEGTLKSYDHADGVKARGFGFPQWFYLHCENCGYDTALWKLKIKMDDLEEALIPVGIKS